MVAVASYGSWVSPISAAAAGAVATSPQWVRLHGGRSWWVQGQPAEQGRVALFRGRPGQPPEQVLAAPWSVRNRVHEYGGFPYVVIVTPDGDRVAFTHWADQRVYLADPDRPDTVPIPISPEPDRAQGLRYADLTASPDGRAVWCVREAATGDAPTDIQRHLVALPVTGAAATDHDAVRVLAASHHFLTGPRPSPDGRRVAWIGWNHPDMPWDGTELCVADLDSDGVPGQHRVLAGGPNEAVCQVEWAGSDAVYALTDPDGWWNLHLIGLDGSSRNLAPASREIGGPLWTLGARWFCPLGDGRHVVRCADQLAFLDEHSGTITDAETFLPAWRPTLDAANGTVVGVAAGPTSHPAVVELDLTSGRVAALTPQPPEQPDARYLPPVQERVFTGQDGQRIPAFVYPPHNPDFVAPDGELPPYLVQVHGGPTGESSGTMNNEISFFTSRGIGVVAVNYGGSSGHGRAFRERLREEWGVVDVVDCAAVAEALAAEGAADPDRLAIRGGSAGGWTTAASLTSVSTYRCGAAYYPILDLLGWATGETHDFESRYLDGLVGPLPETQSRYEDRSPMNRVDKLAGPILLLQGLEDQICPPIQADRFYALLEGRGIPHAYLTFEGEQHGFRKAGTVRRALEAELSFYGQVLGFEPVGVPKLELRT